MRAKEFIIEAFDQPYNLRWEKGDHGNDHDALVLLPDGAYLSIMFNEEGEDEYSVEFWRGHSQSVTGEGDAQRIFATVLAAIAEFIKKYHPRSLSFEAAKKDESQQSDSRAKLYDRLVQRYASALGYRVDRWESGHGVSYELTSTNPGVAEDSLNEFAPTPDFGDGGKEDPESFPLTEFADIIEQYLGRGYTRKDGERPEQVSVKFEPKDKTRNGAILYSLVGKRGEYPTVNIHLLDYEQGFGRGRKAGVAIPKTRDNALKLAELIFNAQLNEFLDDRDGDDGEGISQIVTITDRLLKQGYQVDLAVIGAMGRVYRADLEQTGFTPNGALAIKRKTRHFLRPFKIDDDDKYDFELVGPRHYKIVDTFTKSDTELK